MIQCAKLNGWALPPDEPTDKPFTLVYHTHDSRRSAPGFPDLVLVHPEHGRVVFAELKAEGRYPIPEQRKWLSALKRCPGVEVFLWRPRDWESIVETLGGRDSRLFV